MYTFQLIGRIKPHVRMTQRSKHVDPQAKEYLASKEALQWQIKQQMSRNGYLTIKRSHPIGVVFVTRPARHNCDLDNLIKAVLDAAQGLAYEDDRWIDYIHAYRDNTAPRDVAYLHIFFLENYNVHTTP